MVNIVILQNVCLMICLLMHVCLELWLPPWEISATKTIKNDIYCDIHLLKNPWKLNCFYTICNEFMSSQPTSKWTNSYFIFCMCGGIGFASMGQPA